MKANISNEKRELLWSNYEKGRTPKELSDLLNINVSSVYTILRRIKNSGIVHKQKTCRRNLIHKLTPEIKRYIYDEMDNNASITYSAIQKKVLQTFSVNLHISTVAKFLKNMLFTTKNLTVIPEDRNSVRIKLIRKEYCTNDLENTNKGLEVFIDESGFNFHSHRTRGRSIAGTTAVQTVQTQKGSNISLLAAMSSEGVLHRRVVKGSVTKDIFECFLHELSGVIGNDTDSTFIFDNCRCHFGVQSPFNNHKIERIPPYSPFLNPIEEMFSNIKRQIRDCLSEDFNELANFSRVEREAWLMEKIKNECDFIDGSSSDNY